MKGYERYTVIDVLGNVLNTCQHPQGIIIVLEKERPLPIMKIDEVSDDEVVNLFISVAKGGSGIIDNSNVGDPQSYAACGCGGATQYEFIVGIDKLKEDFEPAWVNEELEKALDRTLLGRPSE